MISIKYGGKIYKNVFESVEWSGSIKTSTRILEVVYLKDKIKFELGKEIEFLVDNNIVFVGDVVDIRQNTKDETYTVKAMDKAFRLNKNSFIKNYDNVLPSEITKEILGELKIDVGDLPLDRTRCTFPTLDRTAYEIILSAYKIQSSKDNKIYSIICDDNKISVVEQGLLIPDTVLSSSVNIRSANYSQSIEKMVNKVILYETKDGVSKIVGIRSNQADIAKYGVFQEVQEQDKTNASYLQVEKLLEGIGEEADLEVDGKIYLTSGYSVPVKVDSLSRLNGVFYIKSDRHIWTSSDYVTYISLAFENVMNDVDIQVAKKRNIYKKEAFKPWEVGT